jgi:hypothetical protein
MVNFRLLSKGLLLQTGYKLKLLCRYEIVITIFTWCYPKVPKIYGDMSATNKTVSSSDDGIYWQLVTHSLTITLTHRQYSVISRF